MNEIMNGKIMKERLKEGLTKCKKRKDEGKNKRKGKNEI